MAKARKDVLMKVLEALKKRLPDHSIKVSVDDEDLLLIAEDPEQFIYLEHEKQIGIITYALRGFTASVKEQLETEKIRELCEKHGLEDMLKGLGIKF